MTLKKKSLNWAGIVVGLALAVQGLLTGNNLQAAPGSSQDVILENEFVRLRICPESGGRIAGFFYKPTGTEMAFWDAASGIGGIAKDATEEQGQAGEYQSGKYSVVSSISNLDAREA